MSRVKRLSKEISWVIIGQLFAFIGALALVRILTEHMSPSEYGRLSLGLTVAGLLSQVVIGGIGAAVGRFYSIASEQQDLGGYFLATRQLIIYSTIASGVMGLAIIIGLYWYNKVQEINLIVAVTVYAILSSFNVILNIIQSSARQRKIVALHSGLEVWLKISFAYIVFKWAGVESTVVIIAFICAVSVILISQMRFIRQSIPINQNQKKSEKNWIEQIWIYSIPITSWTMFVWIQQVSDRWSLQTFSSTADVGKYAVMIQIGYTPIILAASAILSFIAPIIYQRAGDASDPIRNEIIHKLCWQTTYATLIITIIVFFLSLLIHDWYFGLLVATKYRDISYLLPWIVLAAGLFSAGQVLTMKLVSDMKASIMTTGKIFTAILGILLNILGAVTAGTEGVVAALVIFTAIYFGWMSILAKRRLN
jgi:O-antigen/teichoic acid export membrane protein